MDDYTKNVTNKVKSSLVSTAGVLMKHGKSPDDMWGAIFDDVQIQQVFPDGKTFADLVPKTRVKSIKDEYALSKKDPHFDLREFISRHFYDVATTVHKKDEYVADPSKSIDEHIHDLWHHLERRNRVDRGSLIALPYTYIVPGGRFNEQFYWDSYFIMQGLAGEGKWELIEGMIKNMAYLIRKYGHIPTANRTYLLSRSQPPLFSYMVELLASHKGKQVMYEYLPYLLAEYRFWMKGKKKLASQEHRAFLRVAEMSNGVLLNRYYDNRTKPRPESLREDTDTATRSTGRIPNRVFLHLRAAAESGWDFSSRWFADSKDINTIHTADIIPVDLNSLLFHLEQTLASTYRSLHNAMLARRFEAQAESRRQAINTYCWDEKAGFYRDYNFHHGTQTKVLSLAAVFPLYTGLASEKQAAKIAKKLERDFLKQGGLVTTLRETGQQWDAPNGWAPLQFIAVEGLKRYGYDDLARTIRDRWLALNESVYASHHKLVEKYNVLDSDLLGGGGEYPLQDGFGWTNGVYVAMKHDRR